MLTLEDQSTLVLQSYWPHDDILRLKLSCLFGTDCLLASMALSRLLRDRKRQEDSVPQSFRKDRTDTMGSRMLGALVEMSGKVNNAIPI